MSSVNPNPAVCQSVCGKDGGASSVGSALNAVGKWGTALTAVLQGKPVATSKNGVAVGAKGASTLGGVSTTSIVILLIIVVAVIFLLRN
jgi:hypothetical protein